MKLRGRARRIDGGLWPWMAAGWLLLAAPSGCAVVQPYQREYLADPTMQPSEDPMEDQAMRKMHTAREGAAGGDGQAAGGGCGCTN